MALTGEILARASELAGVPINAPREVLNAFADRFQQINTHQKALYEHGWKETLRKFEGIRAGAGSIEDILCRMEPPPESDGLVSAFLNRQSFDVRIDPRKYTAQDNSIVVVRDGKYVQMPCSEDRDTRFIEFLAESVSPQTQAIVELGCGWGRNLASLAVKLDRHDLTYIAAEQSESGRECSAEILGLGERFRYETVDFDFYAPDLSFLSEFDEIVVFTCAAIEQIAFLPPNFIEDVTSAAKRLRLVFLEPIGWQANSTLASTTLHKCLSMVSSGASPAEVINDYIFQIDDTKLEENAAMWSICCCYNMDLMAIIKESEARGLVSLDRLNLNFTGQNLFNPMSLAALQKR